MPADSIFGSKTRSRTRFAGLALLCGSILVGCGDSERPEREEDEAAVTGVIVEKPVPPPMLEPPTPTFETSEPLAPLEKQPAQRFRIADHRVRHDPEKLRLAGIKTYSSKRLILHTDSENPGLSQVPAMVDQLIETLEKELGPLPSATDGSNLQLTGYLMVQQDRFRAAGLIPETLPEFNHGRHRGYEFWLNDQPTDYYRAHLVLHECVHCYMTADPSGRFPVWYLEGMAELFATHAGPTKSDPTVRFGILPASAESAPSWGRTKLIREAVDEGRSPTLAEVLRYPSERFSENDAYAWSWAVCYLLNTALAYKGRFHELVMSPGEDFEASFLEQFGDDELPLSQAWEVFVRTMNYGYDLERAAFAGEGGAEANPLGTERLIEIEAAGGWQSTGIRVKKGQQVHLTASGEVELNSTTRPWISEPRGISREYADGQPIGRLLGWICPAGAITEWPAGRLQTIAIGEDSIVDCDADGTLCLRINDHWNDLANNSGAYQVRLAKTE